MELENNTTSQQLCTRTYGTVIYITWSTRMSLIALNIVISIVTIVSNTFVMVTLHKTKQLRNHSMKLIYVLSLTNVLSGMIAQSCLTILLLIPNQLSCSTAWILLLVIELFIYNSNYLTALLSFDRFLRIRFQHNYYQVYSKSRLKASLFVLYFLISLQAALGLVARMKGTSSTILTIPVNLLLFAGVVYCYWKSIVILKRHQNKIAETVGKLVPQNKTDETLEKGKQERLAIINDQRNNKIDTLKTQNNDKGECTNDIFKTSKGAQQNEKEGKVTSPNLKNQSKQLHRKDISNKETKSKHKSKGMNSSRLSKLPTLYVVIIIIYSLPLIVAMSLLFIMRHSTVMPSSQESYWNKWGSIFYFAFVFFYCYNPTNAILFLIFNKYSREKFKSLFCTETKMKGRQRVWSDTMTNSASTTFSH